MCELRVISMQLTQSYWKPISRVGALKNNFAEYHDRDSPPPRSEQSACSGTKGVGEFIALKIVTIAAR
jgi:hypothetical protein